MADRELVRRVSLETHLPEDEVRAVLDVLDAPRLAPSGRGDPAALVERARAHPLGLGFLLHGYLGSVAALFGVDARTVEAARERLAREDASWPH